MFPTQTRQVARAYASSESNSEDPRNMRRDNQPQARLFSQAFRISLSNGIWRQMLFCAT